METGLRDKRVLVTGGSGGIGAACVRAFNEERARVAVHFHRGRDRADAVGGEAVVGGDLTDEKQAERVFEETRAALGGIDVCAAVAGVWPTEDVPVWELPLERWEQTMRANLTATFLTAREFLREVERNGHGSLVLIASTAGSSARPATPTTRRRSLRSQAACCSASRTRSPALRHSVASTSLPRAGPNRR